MKFRMKSTLSMICLIALLFGVGGSALIYISFHTALEREKTAAYSSYELILSTITVAQSMNEPSGSIDIANVLEQLFTEQTYNWSALRFSSGDKVLYENGPAVRRLVDRSGEIDEGFSYLSYTEDKEGEKNYLQLSSVLDVRGDRLCLEAAYDITSVYQTQRQQTTAFHWIFAFLVGACAILAYTISWFLTRPLIKLSKASREIALGNLTSRSKVNSSDEIGEVSVDFDRMADKVEESILQMKATMERQERFMGSFAHELKTPMTSMIGYADLLRGGTLSDEEQRDAAQYIFAESKRLESLSFKLLDIFVKENEELEFKDVSLKGLIFDLTRHLRPEYEKNGIRISCRCMSGTCQLEPDLVRTLLVNLADNAKKALEDGGTIIISSRIIPEGCLIKIKDNGKGIPPESLAHLTEAFYRVDKSRSRSQGGVGLGLNLCEKIVSLHHGTIRFTSEIGRGTCVTVMLKGGRN